MLLKRRCCGILPHRHVAASIDGISDTGLPLTPHQGGPDVVRPLPEAEARRQLAGHAADAVGAGDGEHGGDGGAAVGQHFSHRVAGEGPRLRIFRVGVEAYLEVCGAPCRRRL